MGKPFNRVAIRGRERGIDWFRVFVQLRQFGFSFDVIVRRTGIPATTLKGWTEGSFPSHHDGEVVEKLWAEVTANSRDSAPRLRDNPPRPRPIPVTERA